MAKFYQLRFQILEKGDVFFKDEIVKIFIFAQLFKLNCIMKNFKHLIGTVILAIMLVLANFNASAQIVTGGTLGVDYENDGFVLELAPQVGYHYKIFESGISPFLLYHQGSDYLSFGGRIYTQATIWRNVFLHAEFQAANVESSTSTGRKWVMGLPLGIGYQEEIMENVWAKAMILYDVLWTEESPQQNPQFRFGITYMIP